jgi:hypothetical protein
MKKVIIQELNSKEVKTHTNGRKFMNCGIKVDGKWFNGSMWENDIARFSRLKPGDEIIVDFYTSEKDGKIYENFKLPSAFQEISYKLDLILSLLSEPEVTKGDSEEELFPEDENPF